jgi:transposase
VRPAARIVRPCRADPPTARPDRYRTTLLAERSREAERLEKELEDAGVKLSSVATDILGVSGRLMLQALIDGERDPVVLAELAKARMRRRIPDLIEALVGNFGEHHAFLCRLHLQRIDQITATIEELSARINEAIAPFRDQLKLLDNIPGVGRGVAEIIIAETGGDMTRFPTAGHLASWAGVCPGMNKSAGRHKPGHTRHGNRWLTSALGTAAMAAARTRDTTFIGARYRRLAGRIGRLKALVAVEHTIITAVWHMLSTTTEYRDLGGDYHIRRDPGQARRRAIRALNQLGYTVTLNPIETAA